MKKFENYVSYLRVLERADRILKEYIPEFQRLEKELLENYNELLNG